MRYEISGNSGESSNWFKSKAAFQAQTEAMSFWSKYSADRGLYSRCGKSPSHNCQNYPAKDANVIYTIRKSV